MTEAWLDREWRSGGERQNHGIEGAVDMDKSPVGTEARRVEAGDDGGDIVMRPLHRGAAGQRHDDGTAVERIERFFRMP